MKRIAWVTAARCAELDEDLPPLAQALPTGEPVVWDDARVDWSRYDAAVVRSTWDYAQRRDEFLTWARRVSGLTRLFNPEPILRWNTDKHYLRELPQAVPTQWIEPGSEISIRFDGEVVVKPAISAGSMDTLRTVDRREAEEFIRKLQSAGRSVMIQPYLTGVDTYGETAMVYLDGRFSHSIRKGPMLTSSMQFVGGLFAKEDIRPRAASPAERALGDRVMKLAGPLVYARVDVAPGPSGEPVVLEFEACEPSLFFAHAEGSAERFVAAILERLDRAR
jgi:glutathione synthase/RimK-type ligase-like ATP-grasp enzyme